MRRLHRPAFTIPLWCCVAAALVWLTCGAQPVCGTPISYVYSGMGTGLLGASTFSNANFTITALADTNNIKPWGDAVGGPQNTHLATIIDISGVGSYLISTPSHTWMDGSHDGSGRGGLGKNLSLNWITLEEHALADYGLNTLIGPVLEVSPTSVEQFHDVLTSGGPLTFMSISVVTFSATLVPEPATGLLVFAALFASQFRRCRRL